MIPVKLQPEPDDFSEKVRNKGVDFLRNTPVPPSWNNREYWREALNDLCTVYGRICAYSSQWMPRTEGSPTVDHFLPKSVKPELAYEWNNFRLACSKLNARKYNFWVFGSCYAKSLVKRLKKEKYIKLVKLRTLV